MKMVTRRIPIVATLVVLAAVATMIGLGLWQLQRAVWKESLLARYQAAAGQAVLDGLPAGVENDPERVAFRRARIDCDERASVVPQLQIGGRSRTGVAGYRNIAVCRRLSGAPLMLDIGVSPPGAGSSPAFLTALDCFGPCPVATFAGVLIPDPQLADRMNRSNGAGGGEDRQRVLPLLLVSDVAARPLQPSVPPSIEDIPNNHRAYAVQWFLFAAVAFTVYLLALRRRAG